MSTGRDTDNEWGQMASPSVVHQAEGISDTEMHPVGIPRDEHAERG